MLRRINHPDMWIVIVGIVLLLAIVYYVVLWHRMPSLSDYALLGLQPFDLPCGRAEQQIWVNGPVDSRRYVVVWTLNGKRLAIVFAGEKYYTSYIDYDFDGKWDQVLTAPTGSGQASDIYEKIEGCLPKP